MLEQDEKALAFCLYRLHHWLKPKNKDKAALKQQRLQAQMAAAGFLPDQDEKALAFCSDRLHHWLKPKNKDKAALKLLKQTGFRERVTNRQTSLSEEEEQRRL